MEKYINNSQLLIDHFNLLEEEHLQLIDDTQNAEYALQEYEKKLQDKKNKYEIKNKEMDNKITEINNYIKEYIDKISYYDNVTKHSKYNITFTNINNKIDYICTQLSYDVNTNEIMKKFQILENKIYSYITTLNKYTGKETAKIYVCVFFFFSWGLIHVKIYLFYFLLFWLLGVLFICYFYFL